MSAGTITVTNGSATVTGTGTSFTTELKAGDFIGVIAGGTPYTLIVASIASNTQLTIGAAYAGPNASGLAWSGVPASLLYAVNQQIMNDMGTALRGMNSQLVNWQKIYSDAASVTVERPDRTTFTGPSWGYMANQFTSKLDKTQNLNDVSNKATAWNNIAQYGTTSTTAARGDDTRLNTIDGKSGGTMTQGTGLIAISAPFSNVSTGQNLDSPIIRSILNGRGGYADARGSLFGFYTSEAVGTTGKGNLIYSGFGAQKYWAFEQSGNAVSQGSWVNGSDERHKSNIKLVPNALKEVLSWRGATYDKKDGEPEVGLIAQDVEKSCPIAVINTGSRTFSDGTVIDDFKALNTSGAAAAYHTEAIKALFNLVELALAAPEKALASIDSIKEALASESAS